MDFLERTMRRIKEEQHYLRNMDNLRKSMPEREVIVGVYPTQAIALSEWKRLKSEEPTVTYRIRRSATGLGFLITRHGR